MRLFPSFLRVYYKLMATTVYVRKNFPAARGIWSRREACMKRMDADIFTVSGSFCTLFVYRCAALIKVKVHALHTEYVNVFLVSFAWLALFARHTGINGTLWSGLPADWFPDSS